MTNFEKFVKKIMKEAEKDGEPLTEEEAIEVAKLEIKANSNKTYILAENEDKSGQKQKKPRKVKKDAEKLKIIQALYDKLIEIGYDATIENDVQKIKIGEDFTVTLTKHRKKKESE